MFCVKHDILFHSQNKKGLSSGEHEWTHNFMKLISSLDSDAWSGPFHQIEEDQIILSLKTLGQTRVCQNYY